MKDFQHVVELTPTDFFRIIGGEFESLMFERSCTEVIVICGWAKMKPSYD